jgi:nucleoside-diphosphate-sugar epimerase
MKKNILLIGSEGYIGSSLNIALSANNLVHTCDILPSKSNNGYHYTKNYGNFTKKEISKYDFIVLLAAHSSVHACIQNPQEAIENNIVNFLKLLTIMSDGQTLIYASSGSVYDGYMDTYPNEGAKILRSRNIYDFTKISNDFMASTFTIPTIGLRFGTLSGYSPIMREDLIINKMTKDALNKKIITVSNSTAFRSCLGISDLCKAITTIVKYHNKINESTSVFNLASFSASIDLISNEIARITGAHIKYVDDSPTYNFSMSVEKFEKTFDFKFQDSIETITAQLIDKMAN